MRLVRTPNATLIVVRIVVENGPRRPVQAGRGGGIVGLGQSGGRGSLNESGLTPWWRSVDFVARLPHQPNAPKHDRGGKHEAKDEGATIHIVLEGRIRHHV